MSVTVRFVGMYLPMVQLSEEEARRVMALDADALLAWLEGGAEEHPTLDLDKAWHGLHHVLTGTAWDTDGDLGAVILGGEEFGEDFGYGASRWLAPDEVRRLTAGLEAITPEVLAERIDLPALARDDVYPGVWDRADEADDLRAWLTDSFFDLRRAFVAARDVGDGFVVSLT